MKVIRHKHIIQQDFCTCNSLLDEEAPLRLDDQLASQSASNGVDELLDVASQLDAITKNFNTLCFNHFLAGGCGDCTVSVSLSLYPVYILSDFAMCQYAYERGHTIVVPLHRT